ncbi:MAG: helix-turn-helix transcriptional regulator, partial [Nitrososphaerales archaeon]
MEQQHQAADLASELLGRSKSNILKSLLTEDYTVSELTERFHVIGPGIRKHLEYMEKIGLVSSFFRREGLGRPKKHYTITPLGRSLFPKMYDRLLDILIGRLTGLRSESGKIMSEQLLEETASDLAMGFNSKTASFSFDQKLQSLEDFLNQLG